MLEQPDQPASLSHEDDDSQRLHALGYAQVLARQLKAFSNFALSLSIICILAGGVTSFHLGLCSVGGASIGLGWPLVGLFAMAVAATMGQLASTFPTAGGLYHWAAILGGRGWGWITAWFNLAGLVTVLAAINVGTYRFAMGGLFPGARSPDFDFLAQSVFVGLITISQALINHVGIRTTARLTDFSGYWILFVAAVLTGCLLTCAPAINPMRLITIENFSGTVGGSVWPVTSSLALLFSLGVLLPAYTITGFDASAHAAEETIGAAQNVPRAIFRSVVVSVVAGWIMLAAVVLAAPSLPAAAAQGEGAFLSIIHAVLPRTLVVGFVVAIVLAQYLCGLATVTSASRMAFAFARDGGLPFARAHRLGLPSTAFTRCRCLDRLIGFDSLHDSYAVIRNHHGRLYHFSLSVVRAPYRPWSLGVWPELDSHGPVGPRSSLSTTGIAQPDRLHCIDLHRDATS